VKLTEQEKSGENQKSLEFRDADPVKSKSLDSLLANHDGAAGVY
jgi:hypothetical protein